MIYEKRLLAFTDILGWSAVAYGGDPAKLLSAVNTIRHASRQRLCPHSR
jgi:hypothetical protein